MSGGDPIQPQERRDRLRPTDGGAPPIFVEDPGARVFKSGPPAIEMAQLRGGEQAWRLGGLQVWRLAGLEVAGRREVSFSDWLLDRHYFGTCRGNTKVTGIEWRRVV